MCSKSLQHIEVREMGRCTTNTNLSLHNARGFLFSVLIHKYAMCYQISNERIGRVSLARENEAGRSWGQEVHILHVNV